MIKNVCFINNYNNEKYLAECLNSVFSQTLSFDQVIIVDDGSTDRSVDVISEFLLKYPNLLLKQKNNEGQISTFNFVASSLPDLSQIFFLDGDDIYPLDYLELATDLLGTQGWDFAFCEKYEFSDAEPQILDTSLMQNLPTQVIHSSSALARSRKCWIGNVTSTLSISARLFKQIFPYPGYLDKPLFVDDLINYASSILGVTKVYLPSLRVGWRSHEANISKRAYTSEDIINRDIAIERLFNWFCMKYKIPRYPNLGEFFEEYHSLGAEWQIKLDLPNKFRIVNRLIRDLTKQSFIKILNAVR